MLPLEKATGQPRGHAGLEVAVAEPGSLDAPRSLAVVTLNKVTGLLQLCSVNCADAS